MYAYELNDGMSYELNMKYTRVRFVYVCDMHILIIYDISITH